MNYLDYFCLTNSIRTMVSRLRMKLDLSLQGVLLTVLALVTSLEPWRTATVVALLILACIQISSAAQMWFWHHYRPAKIYLWLFFVSGVLLPFCLHFFNSMAWLCMMATVVAYFLHTIYVATIVLRRPRSFWDLT